MGDRATFGLRMFLYGVLELIKKQNEESYSVIENEFSSGIATFLYSKYTNVFDSVGFNPDNIRSVDEYYQSLSGIADGKEGKYCCELNDGLYLVIKLALNGIF